MEKTHIIIILLIVIIIILVNNLYNRQENITSDSGKTLSDEALQNIASVYGDSKNTVSFNNVNITGNTIFTQFKGIIVAWSGSTADIEKISSGWGLCDGTSYTALDQTQLQSPDLRSKFILGASKPNTNDYKTIVGPSGQPSYIDVSGNTVWLTPQQVGKQNGEETHVLSETEMPSHNHFASCGFANSSGGAPIGYSTNDGWANGPPQNTSKQNAGNTGGNQPHNNMPPYYVLAYIIKL
jgi:microcystin-dependent protein